ncbi:MAG: phosphoenolpyruvate carboxykinase [Elusimicrobia bacterium RIFCSPLOWO2_01_FULL_60_11]|nr:MAG: phosphoenolpyruvate carboxykinase [Elusimicrobia bacterium RIFCSPLOWO2_01_FULL_60_11]
MEAPTKNKQLISWVQEVEKMCRPDKVVWVNGSDAEKKHLEEEACSTGELIKLDEKKLPGSFYHRSNPNDVARTESLTFICTKSKEDAGPTNNWMAPAEAYKKAGEIFSGSMKGRAMYVTPFSMGPVGSKLSKIGVEITDSIYVVLNMRIMTRVGEPVLKVLGENGQFTKCLHSKADLDIKRRLILHFPEDNTIWSVGSGYGGNALLGKKCLALRIASWLGKTEGWMAEHMLILGIDRPGKETKYITTAFPSACGKTNLAMLIPPEGYIAKGYRVWTVGDDISWLKIGPDGTLRAINPEAGFFGVIPGTNSKSNPNAVKTIRKNTIYTNAALTPDKNVWWEGSDDPAPAEATDWKGNKWKPGLKDENGKPVVAAHPNSRFTAPAGQCPCISPKWEDPEGVPISAILFGGRRANVMPLVFETLSWNHGVFSAATVGSEKTAAQEGTVGEIRRDPMAMLPFCGYNMGDYFAHWIGMGKKIPKLPKIFHVNWFRTDDHGKFMWPGFGDNMRVLDWVLDRCEGKADAVQTPIGFVPKASGINTEGLNLAPGTMEKLVAVNQAEWRAEQADQEKFFKTFGERFPKELWDEFNSLKKRLG